MLSSWSGHFNSLARGIVIAKLALAMDALSGGVDMSPKRDLLQSHVGVTIDNLCFQAQLSIIDLVCVLLVVYLVRTDPSSDSVCHLRSRRRISVFSNMYLVSFFVRKRSFHTIDSKDVRMPNMVRGQFVIILGNAIPTILLEDVVSVRPRRQREVSICQSPASQETPGIAILLKLSRERLEARHELIKAFLLPLFVRLDQHSVVGRAALSIDLLGPVSALAGEEWISWHEPPLLVRRVGYAVNEVYCNQ
mmetsp:Transcript_542/g.1236  ORF Transcript_542/g.1236 Transcript_542/m.1236 type:complete len:249 (+) Transcript_542:670-1416(+)